MSNSATPWTTTHQAPLSMELSRQEYWSGLPFPTPGDLPNPRDWTWVSCVSLITVQFSLRYKVVKKICVHFVFFKISRWLNFLLLLPFSQQFFKKSKVHFLPIVTYWYFCMTYKWSTIMMSHGHGKSHVCSEKWNGHRKHLVHSGPVYYQLPLRDSCVTLWVTLPSVLLSIVTASYTHQSFHQRWLCGPLRDAFGNQNACLQMSVQHREWLP